MKPIKSVVYAAALTILSYGTTQAKDMNENWRHGTGWHLPLSVAVKDAPKPILFVTQKTGGVKILRDRNNKIPKHLATIHRRDIGEMDAMNVVYEGNTLYISLGDHFRTGTHAGLAIVDVTKPRKPKVLSVWKSPRPSSGSSEIVVDKGFAYLGSMKAGVHILDVRSVEKPKLVSTFQPDVHFPKPNPNSVAHPNARGLDVVGNLLFVAYDAGGLRVVDISNKSLPIEVGRYINSGTGKKQQAYNKVLVQGNLAYVTVDYCGLEVIDVSVPNAIRQLAWWNPWNCETNANTWFNSPGHTNQIALDKKKNRLYMSAGDSELIEMDVSTATEPRLIKIYGEVKDGQGADTAYLTYIRTFIPFSGKWAGVRAVPLD